MITDADEITDHELIVLAISEEALPEAVSALSARARRGQIYLHTSLGYGVQVLDLLETTGAIVGAAHQVNERLWVTEAADELGETIVELLVGELGGSAVRINESQRPRLAAALTYIGVLDTVRSDATNLFMEALGDLQHVEELISTQRPGTRLADVDGPSGIAAQHDTIEDPGLARAFREMVRRTAQLSRADDVELWAIQQE